MYFEHFEITSCYGVHSLYVTLDIISLELGQQQTQVYFSNKHFTIIFDILQTAKDQVTLKRYWSCR